MVNLWCSWFSFANAISHAQRLVLQLHVKCNASKTKMWFGVIANEVLDDGEKGFLMKRRLWGTKKQYRHCMNYMFATDQLTGSIFSSEHDELLFCLCLSGNSYAGGGVPRSALECPGVAPECPGVVSEGFVESHRVWHSVKEVMKKYIILWLSS